MADILAELNRSIRPLGLVESGQCRRPLCYVTDCKMDVRDDAVHPQHPRLCGVGCIDSFRLLSGNSNKELRRFFSEILKFSFFFHLNSVKYNTLIKLNIVLNAMSCCYNPFLVD